MIERRRYPRLPISIPLELLTPGSLVSQGKAQTVNLSLSGLAFESDVQLSNGLNLFLYSDMPLNLSGRIVRRESSGGTTKYGLRLDSLDTLDKIKLRQYINLHLHKKYNMDNSAQ